MGELHMRLGSNLPQILLEIAQEHIINGETDKVFETYTDSLHGFTKEYALMILKNEAVLTVDDNGVNMNMSDDPELLKENADNIYDWNYLVLKKSNDLLDYVKTYYSYVERANKLNICLYNYDIKKTKTRYFGDDANKIGIDNLCARVLADNPWSNQLSNGSNIWQHLIDNVENDEAHPYEYHYYLITRYVKLIRTLHKEYVKFSRMYEFLLENNFINKIPRIENDFEIILKILVKFTDQNFGYHHPMCDEYISDYKDQLFDDIMHTKWGNEYLKYGIIEKDIMDGYDAGWLSPDGHYYADNGETSNLIHLNLAEQLFEKKLKIAMENDGVTRWSSNSPDEWLIHHGWMKIHYDECYGYYRWYKDDPKETRLYCPTDTQIKMICDYADKYYGGMIYTEAQTFGSRITHKEAYKTSAIRQMNEIQLHETFKL